jgi:hypothetical protein
VFAWLAAVIQNILVVATGILEGIGKDRHTFKGFLSEDATGKGKDAGRKPRGDDSDGAEGVAEDAAEQFRLAAQFIRA